MKFSALIIGLILVVSAAQAQVTSVELAADKADAGSDAEGFTTPGRSDIECAAKCVSMGVAKCSAVAFAADRQMCWLNGVRNAELAMHSDVKPPVVYRLPIIPVTESQARVGERLFHVIQHRSKGELSFQRNWLDYENGFGDGTDFWLGLKAINSLTDGSPRLLRVEVTTWADVLYVSEYSGFSVGGAGTNYTMTFNSYLASSSNTTSDSLAYHNGHKFSTIDVDNDSRSTSSCSETLGGRAGWWFNACLFSNPKGIYYSSAVIDSERAMHWVGADGRRAVKSIRMMLQI